MRDAYAQHTATHTATIATHYNALQHITTHCNTLKKKQAMSSDGPGTWTPMRNTLQHTLHSAMHWHLFKKTGYVVGWLEFRDAHTQYSTSTHYYALHHTAMHCWKIQKHRLCRQIAWGVWLLWTTHCNTLQHTATRFNALISWKKTGCVVRWLRDRDASAQHITATQYNTPPHTGMRCIQKWKTGYVR